LAPEGKKRQRAECSLLRVRALRRPSALPTIQSCRSRLGTTPLAAASAKKTVSSPSWCIAPSSGMRRAPSSSCGQPRSPCVHPRWCLFPSARPPVVSVNVRFHRPFNSGGLNSSVTEHSRCHRGTALAHLRCMGVTKQLRQYVGRRATKRLYRAMPWIGSVVALATLGAAVRRKGFLGGTADTVLDFIPWVGGVKNLTEAARGGDFIRDKPPSRS
jgi:hypothetical protein